MTTPTWTAFYGNKQFDDTIMSSYQSFLKHKSTQNASVSSAISLSATDDVVVLTVSMLQKVKLLHHFHYDAPTALQHGTKELWALMGHGTDAVSVIVDHSSVFTTKLEAKCPPFEALLTTSSPDAFAKITLNPSSSKDCPCTLNFIAIPAFLAAAFMRSGSDDPATLALLAITTLTEFLQASLLTIPPSASSPIDLHDDPLDTVPNSDFTGTDPTNTPPDALMQLASIDLLTHPVAKCFHYIPQFLWVMANRDLSARRDLHVHMEIVHTGRCAKWARRVHHDKLTPLHHVNTKVPHTLPPSAPTDATLRLLHDSMTTVKNAMEHNSTAKQSADKKSGFSKLGPHIQRMILNATERQAGGIITTDATVAYHPCEPVASFANLLEVEGINNVSCHLRHILRMEQSRDISLPASLSSSLHSGFLLWSHLGQPGPFSIFSCFGQLLHDHTEFADDLTLHLKSAEGKGLTDRDCARQAQIVHRVPLTLDAMSNQFGNMHALCALLLGANSLLCRAIAKWIRTFSMHQVTYRQLIAADPSFPTKLAYFVDCRIQRFLQSCAQALHYDEVDTALLSFDLPMQSIVDGIFHHDSVPNSLMSKVGLSFVRKRSHAVGEPSPEPVKPRQQGQPPSFSRGDPVQSPHPDPELLVDRNEFKPFLDRTHIPTCPTVNGITVCLNWHLHGSCQSQCFQKTTHQALQPNEKKALLTWMAGVRGALVPTLPTVQPRTL